MVSPFPVPAVPSDPPVGVELVTEEGLLAVAAHPHLPVALAHVLVKVGPHVLAHDVVLAGARHLWLNKDRDRIWPQNDTLNVKKYTIC